MKIAIAGIHTGIGKTVCSSVMCQALGYDYFKPVQAGDLAHTDSDFIRNTVSVTSTKIFPENYLLNTPASPHYAAQLDGLVIDIKKLILPETESGLIVETAGGIMSPLNETMVNTDLLTHFNLPVILVSKHYLGSINHTLCSIELLKAKGIRLLGIVFNGDYNEPSEKYILKYSGLPHLFSIPSFEEPDRDKIKKFSDGIGHKLKEQLLLNAR
jgi:dethiobiotin synthetase